MKLAPSRAGFFVMSFQSQATRHPCGFSPYVNNVKNAGEKHTQESIFAL